MNGRRNHAVLACALAMVTAASACTHSTAPPLRRRTPATSRASAAPPPLLFFQPRVLTGATPFTSCHTSGRSFVYAEVGPWIAVDPSDPTHQIAAWQQDRGFTGGARGMVTAWTADGGATWSTAVPSNLTTCTKGAPTS